MCNYVVVLVAFLFGCYYGNASSSCVCRQKQWQIVTRNLIKSITLGVKVSYNDSANGVEINANALNYGCGQGPGSGAVFYVQGDWTHIRYTQEFYGASGCWKIFGTTASPKYRKSFAFGAKMKVPWNDVKDFDASVGDGIFNEHRMGTSTIDKFNGRVYRCDPDAKTNFWHSSQGPDMRRATVVLRRNGAMPAGITTETSCGRPRYVIKDIWVLI